MKDKTLTLTKMFTYCGKYLHLQEMDFEFQYDLKYLKRSVQSLLMTLCLFAPTNGWLQMMSMNANSIYVFT